jgi:hypothetical protein
MKPGKGLLTSLLVLSRTYQAGEKVKYNIKPVLFRKQDYKGCNATRLCERQSPAGAAAFCVEAALTPMPALSDRAAARGMRVVAL